MAFLYEDLISFFNEKKLKVENKYSIDLIYLNFLENTGHFEIPLFFIKRELSAIDEINSFVKLLIIIHSKTLKEIPTPKYLAVFNEKAFFYLDFIKIRHLLDYNVDWKISSSDYSKEKFKKIKEVCIKDLRKEIKTILPNHLFSTLSEITDNKFYNNGKLIVTEDFFIDVYKKWVNIVLPTIDINNPKEDLIQDLFFAELSDNKDLPIYNEDGSFFIKSETYGFDLNKSFGYKDGQEESKKFWNLYERPSDVELSKIIGKKNFLSSAGKRSRAGAFYTPDIWVRKSQEYLKNYLGNNWQNDYYIWDCCTGTGNLLKGLLNPERIFASTLDYQDVETLKLSNFLKKENIFQFDFLNDEFDKCPQKLQDIINDSEKRKKLIIYINPPYAEATNFSSHYDGSSSLKKGVYNTKIFDKYPEMGRSKGELFVQFLYRIYKEIPECIIGEFSTLKIIQNIGCEDLRKVFMPKLENCFIVPSKTFDNVKGDFIIGFKIWNCSKKESFKGIEVDVFDEKGNLLGKKKIIPASSKNSINKWLDLKKEGNCIGYLHIEGNDFSHNTMVFISQDNNGKGKILKICQDNLIPCSIYLAVRRCIPTNWLNTYDQFLIPNDDWKRDKEFQADCLVYTIFSSRNYATSTTQGCYWVPFSKEELSIENSFMCNYLEGNIIKSNNGFAISKNFYVTKKDFSKKAWDLYNSALELWKYYSTFKNPNVSLYDIRSFFQGQEVLKEGSVKLGLLSKSDIKYQKLRKDVTEKATLLLNKISKKAYDYGFLVKTYDFNLEIKH